MRIWARTLKQHKIQNDVVREFSLARPSDLEGWIPVLHELCQALDLSRPIILNKHVHELNSFSHTAFRSSDFMESIPFDSFEIEILKETKKNEDPFSRSY